MRLIDADALTEELKKWLKDKELHRSLGTAEEIWCNDAEIEVLETIIDDISRMPTVEAKPIIHAKWEPDEESSVEKPCYRCSNCGAVLEEDYNWHNHNFCYHCGAKMDGEENESS